MMYTTKKTSLLFFLSTNLAHLLCANFAQLYAVEDLLCKDTHVVCLLRSFAVSCCIDTKSNLIRGLK